MAPPALTTVARTHLVHAARHRRSCRYCDPAAGQGDPAGPAARRGTPPAESQLAGQLWRLDRDRSARRSPRPDDGPGRRPGAGAAAGSFVRAPDDPGQLERPLRLLSLHELRDIGDHRAAIASTAARAGRRARARRRRHHTQGACRTAPRGDRPDRPLSGPTRGCTSRSPRPPSRPGSPARRWTCGPRSVTWSGCRWRARTWRRRPATTTC